MNLSSNLSYFPPKIECRVCYSILNYFGIITAALTIVGALLTIFHQFFFW